MSWVSKTCTLGNTKIHHELNMPFVIRELWLAGLEERDLQRTQDATVPGFDYRRGAANQINPTNMTWPGRPLTQGHPFCHGWGIRNTDVMLRMEGHWGKTSGECTKCVSKCLRFIPQLLNILKESDQEILSTKIFLQHIWWQIKEGESRDKAVKGDLSKPMG